MADLPFSFEVDSGMPRSDDSEPNTDDLEYLYDCNWLEDERWEQANSLIKPLDNLAETA